MKKKFSLLALILAIVLCLSSCSIPIIGDFIQSDSSLGKTNNTAVAIAEAMKDYLKSKKKAHFSLYGMELILNNDGNGIVRLYYTGETPESAEYSDVYVAEVDSKTGHVERFERADYAKDGLTPYRMVREGVAFDAATLPIDSNKAISIGVKSFSSDLEFHYDYVQLTLSTVDSYEQYEIRYISMLNDIVYSCRVDAVSGKLLESTKEPLE